MKTLNDYNDPYDAILEFEEEIAEYTGAPFVVCTDSCTHAIELCFRYKESINEQQLTATLPARTYLSVPMVLTQLGIKFVYDDYNWDGEYNIGESNVWDSARLFEEDMYICDAMQCLSFGHSKPLEIGRGGAILLDEEDAYNWLKKAVYDGRDLTHKNWAEQVNFNVGYHYMMRPEEAILGLNMLASDEVQGQAVSDAYPDLRKITIQQ